MCTATVTATGMDVCTGKCMGVVSATISINKTSNMRHIYIIQTS